jgi:signal recognition particle receptor subunit beta
MVVVSYSGREINAKIVYYGPGLSGKTTNLEKIYDSVPETNRGRMVSMKTQTDRTLFFDLLPLDLGELQGMKTRFLLYTVPGQVYYNATRKLVLKGVDAVVFVADSAPDKMAENRESFSNLETNLKSYGLDAKSVPLVIQYNKRDLPNAVPVDQMNKELNRYNVPTFEAQAASGVGVFETLRGVSKLLLSKISKDVIDRDRGSLAGSPRVANEEVSAKPAAVEETPTQTSTPPPAGRGKLMQFLKRGMGEEAPAPEPVRKAPAPEPVRRAPAPEPARRAPAPEPEEAPMLSDEIVLEQAPPSLSRYEPSGPGQEEVVLTQADLVPERPVPEFVKQSEDASFSAGEIEREATYGSSASTSSHTVEATSADTRQITVPIELGSLPPSGRLKLVFEVRIEVESDAPDVKKAKKTSSRSGAMMRDLESIG